MAEPSTASTNGPTTRSNSTGDSTVSRSASELKPTSSGQQTTLQQDRMSVIDRVRQSATEQFTTQKDRGIDALENVTQAVRSSSQRLRDEKHETIASYFDQAVDQIDIWSRRIKEKDLDQFVTDVQRLARRQPAVFIGSAFALGLLGARFLKSSRPENELGTESHRTRDGGGNYRSAASDRSARTTVGADAEVAIRAHEAAIPDGSPAASGSRAATGANSANRSSRSRQSSPRTERS